ncbi:MAG: hypothetical protein BAJALOKI1v1_1210002 [Promethearchaeota archaeon]|nr:MAG: hypothetical protein BAJALOKI1v1_1210002 [Candidatus Lokiarchaeota archaeon]
MITKNISVNLRENQEIPWKETYVVIQESRKKVILHQKVVNSKENQVIELNLEECERLMNILFHYAFKRNYNYSKDKVIFYRE